MRFLGYNKVRDGIFKENEALRFTARIKSIYRAENWHIPGGLINLTGAWIQMRPVDAGQSTALCYLHNQLMWGQLPGDTGLKTGSTGLRNRLLPKFLLFNSIATIGKSKMREHAAFNLFG